MPLIKNTLNKTAQKLLFRQNKNIFIISKSEFLPVWPMYIMRRREIFNDTDCINLQKTSNVIRFQNMYISKILGSFQRHEISIMHVLWMTVSSVLYVLIARLINFINCLPKIVSAECWHQFQISLCVSQNSTYATHVLSQMHETILL